MSSDLIVYSNGYPSVLNSILVLYSKDFLRMNQLYIVNYKLAENSHFELQTIAIFGTHVCLGFHFCTVFTRKLLKFFCKWVYQSQYLGFVARKPVFGVSIKGNFKPVSSA